MKITFVLIRTDQSAKIFYEDGSHIIIPKSKVDFDVDIDKDIDIAFRR